MLDLFTDHLIFSFLITSLIIYTGLTINTFIRYSKQARMYTDEGMQPIKWLYYSSGALNYALAIGLVIFILYLNSTFLGFSSTMYLTDTPLMYAMKFIAIIIQVLILVPAICNTFSNIYLGVCMKILGKKYKDESEEGDSVSILPDKYNG